jgi:hypothetical protein
MNIQDGSVEHYEMILWDTINAVSNAKKSAKSTPDQLKEELRILQNELMEASEWLKKAI